MHMELPQNMVDFIRLAGVAEEGLKTPLISITIRRSMNQAPSPEENRHTEQQLATAKAKIHTLQSLAEANAATCKAACDKASEQSVQVMNERGKAYEAIRQTDGTIKQISAELAALEGARQGMEMRRHTLEGELNAVHARIREMERKRAEARKWCWVPFYGLALAIDQLANDHKRVETINQCMREYQEQQRVFEAALGAHQRKKAQSSAELREVDVRYQQLTAEEQRLRDEITRLKIAVVQWDNMAMYYNMLSNRLEAALPADMEQILKELEEKDDVMRQLAAA